MQVHENSCCLLTSVHKLEHIHKRFYQIRIWNIFIFRLWTKYEYRIYWFFTTYTNTNIEYIRSKQIGRIQISNIFITRKLSICVQISNIRCLIFEYSNIQIYLCYTGQLLVQIYK